MSLRRRRRTASHGCDQPEHIRNHSALRLSAWPGSRLVCRVRLTGQRRSEGTDREPPNACSPTALAAAAQTPVDTGTFGWVLRAVQEFVFD